MSKLETQITQHFDKARVNALIPLIDEAREVLPDGWSINLAVGWGFIVYDADGGDWSEDDLPARMPKGVRPLVKACAYFFDVFGPENDRITNKGVSYPAKRKGSRNDR